VLAITGNTPTTGQDLREKLAELSPLMAASFLVQASNAAITTMIAIVIAQRGGEQSDVSLIAACYALGGMLFPIYSVASALAFDRAEGRSMIDISTSLLVIYSIGSIAGPFTVMAISEITGSPGC
jgi:hypothetical protein